MHIVVCTVGIEMSPLISNARLLLILHMSPAMGYSDIAQQNAEPSCSKLH